MAAIGEAGLPALDGPKVPGASGRRETRKGLDGGEHASGLAARGEAVSRYRADIDGLRALAVIPVLMFHFGLSWLPGGFTGVDVFFVISGFVIAASIVHDLEHDRFSIANFYFKRIRRIIPALYAVLIVTTLAASMILLPSDYNDYGKSLISTSLFISNLYFWKASGYFQPVAQYQPLLHTWSLAVEEQFYIFAPIVFALIFRQGRRWLTWLLPVLLLSFAASVAAGPLAPTAGFFVLPTRVWELTLGALVAVRPPITSPSRRARELMAAGGLVLILAGMILLDETDSYPFWNASLPCVGTALLIRAGQDRQGTGLPAANRLLASRPLVWVGGLSYSLYLVHWPLVALMRYTSLRQLSLFDVAGLSLASLTLAWLSWRFVERPFRHLPLSARNKVLWAGATAVIVGAATGVTIVGARGFPARFPDFQERRIAGVEEWGEPVCFNRVATRMPDWSVSACTRVHGHDAGRVLLWGDSFAAHYIPGLIRSAQHRDADLLQYTLAGCPPVLAYTSLNRLGCGPFNRRALEIIRHRKVNRVVLAARWFDTPSASIARLGDTIKAIRGSGAQVVVIGQSPLFAADIQHIDYLLGNARLRAPGTAPVVNVTELNARLADQARSAGAAFVDPMKYLCQTGGCPYRTGDDYYYADFGHLSTLGSTRAVNLYFPG